LDILGHFGLNLVVVPHWNNAEGGNHDTRYCFMGQSRLAQLETLLPESTPILGLDEHTVLIVDLCRQSCTIQGIGHVTLRRKGREKVYTKADDIPFAQFSGDAIPASDGTSAAAPEKHESESLKTEDTHWTTLHQLEDRIVELLSHNHAEQATHTLLELERHIWNAREEIEEDGGMGAAREVLREIITQFGQHLAARPISHEASIGPMVEALISLRQKFREQRNWEAGDMIRDVLGKANVTVEDTPDGARWHIQN
jgi:hypothetical protein